MPSLTWFPHVIMFMTCLSVRQMQSQDLALWFNFQLFVTFVFPNPDQTAKYI